LFARLEVSLIFPKIAFEVFLLLRHHDFILQSIDDVNFVARYLLDKVCSGACVLMMGARGMDEHTFARMPLNTPL
jgi:hypothetical protein